MYGTLCRYVWHLVLLCMAPCIVVYGTLCRYIWRLILLCLWHLISFHTGSDTVTYGVCMAPNIAVYETHDYVWHLMLLYMTPGNVMLSGDIVIYDTEHRYKWHTLYGTWYRYVWHPISLYLVCDIWHLVLLCIGHKGVAGALYCRCGPHVLSAGMETPARNTCGLISPRLLSTLALQDVTCAIIAVWVFVCVPVYLRVCFVLFLFIFLFLFNFICFEVVDFFITADWNFFLLDI